MNSPLYATVIISEWPVCEPAPVGDARLLGRPLAAYRGGVGPWENTRAWRAISRAAPAQVLLAAGYSPWMRDSAAQGRVRDTGAPAVAPAKKRRQQKTPWPGAEKKSPPLLLCFWSPTDTENNSQLSGCDFNILCQDPGSIPAPYKTKK